MMGAGRAKKILATPRSFGKENRAPIDLLERAGFEVVCNPTGAILSKEEMKALIADVSGVIIGVDPLDAEVLGCAPGLKAISKYGVGVDNIDLEYARKMGIPVRVAHGSNTEAVADYAFCLMLACARKLLPIAAQCKNGDWRRVTGMDVYGKTLGILGLGAIGKAVARRAKGFSMRVMAFDAVWDEAYLEENEMQVSSLEEIYAHADFISLHLPLTAETQGLISYEAFRRMKPSAVLINTARGGIVDEEALVEALREKRIYAAGIDAFSLEPPENEALYTLDNLILSPHCGGATVGAVERMGELAAKNLLTDLLGGHGAR